MPVTETHQGRNAGPEPRESSVELLKLRGVDARRLHAAVRVSRGELILSTNYSIPGSMRIGILDDAEGITDITQSMLPEGDIGWKVGQVPVTRALFSGDIKYKEDPVFNATSLREVEIDSMDFPIAVGRSDGESSDYFFHVGSHWSIGNAYRNDIVLGIQQNFADLKQKIHTGGETGALAIGNASVGYLATRIADREFGRDFPSHLSIAKSYGLLILSGAAQLGVEWRPPRGEDPDLDKTLQRLEKGMIDYGVVPVILKHLGWHDDTLSELGVARRLQVFDLSRDKVKQRIMDKIHKASQEKQVAAEVRYQRDVVSERNGDHSRFVEATVDNILTNYFALPQ